MNIWNCIDSKYPKFINQNVVFDFFRNKTETEGGGRRGRGGGEGKRRERMRKGRKKDDDRKGGREKGREEKKFASEICLSLPCCCSCGSSCSPLPSGPGERWGLLP